MLTEEVSSTKEAGLLSDGRRIFNFTSRLSLKNIQEKDVGNFQCIITNKFGSAYSVKANITIHGMLYEYQRISLHLKIFRDTLSNIEDSVRL